MNNAALLGLREMAALMSVDPAVALRDKAHAQVAQWPQYTRESFDAYVLVRMKRTITTKAGRAFFKGEIAIAKRAFYPEIGERVAAWSISNRMATVVNEGDVEFL